MEKKNQKDEHPEGESVGFDTQVPEEPLIGMN